MIVPEPLMQKSLQKSLACAAACLCVGCLWPQVCAAGAARGCCSVPQWGAAAGTAAPAVSTGALAKAAGRGGALGHRIAVWRLKPCTHVYHSTEQQQERQWLQSAQAPGRSCRFGRVFGGPVCLDDKRSHMCSAVEGGSRRRSACSQHRRAGRQHRSCRYGKGLRVIPQAAECSCMVNAPLCTML